MWTADLILILLILISALICYKRGFVKSSLRLLSFFIAIALSLMLYKPTVEWLKGKTTLEEWITQNITSEENIEQTIDKNIETEGVETLPEEAKEASGIEKAKDNIIKTAATTITDAIMNLIAIIIIYVISRLGLTVACFILDGIMKIPILKQVNEILGLILGIILGLFQGYLALAVIKVLMQIMDLNVISYYITNSAIVSKMFENNLLVNFIF